jgi:hypothetical protein
LAGEVRQHVFHGRRDRLLDRRRIELKRDLLPALEVVVDLVRPWRGAVLAVWGL